MTASLFYRRVQEQWQGSYRTLVNIAWEKGPFVEMSYLKLHPLFFENPPVAV
jgi:hypothetical protein